MTDAPPTRRGILSACTLVLLTFMTGAIVAPVVAYVTGPLRRKPGSPNPIAGGDDFADAGPIDSIPLNQWKLLPIEITRQDGWAKSRESRSIWVTRSGSSAADVRVLSPICPHLGCPLTQSTDTKTPGAAFRCPCHGGVFDDAGKHIAGPPPRNMDTLDFQVRDGHLWVRWQDFNIGVPNRVPVQV
jgi:Rieske Fe-S protein